MLNKWNNNNLAQMLSIGIHGPAQAASMSSKDNVSVSGLLPSSYSVSHRSFRSEKNPRHYLKRCSEKLLLIFDEWRNMMAGEGNWGQRRGVSVAGRITIIRCYRWKRGRNQGGHKKLIGVIATSKETRQCIISMIIYMEYETMEDKHCTGSRGIILIRN